MDGGASGLLGDRGCAPRGSGAAAAREIGELQVSIAGNRSIRLMDVAGDAQTLAAALKNDAEFRFNISLKEFFNHFINFQHRIICPAAQIKSPAVNPIVI